MSDTPSFAIPTSPPDELTPGVLPGYVDPSAGAPDPFADDLPGAEGEDTPLTALLAELKTAMVRGERTIEIPGRPGWAVTYRTDLTDKDMKTAQKAARVPHKPKNPDGSYEVDEIKLSALLLGQYCTALHRGGKVVEVSPGVPMTFRSEILMRNLGKATVADTVREVYGTDGGVVGAGRALMASSGWMDDPDDVDAGPTRG